MTCPALRELGQRPGVEALLRALGPGRARLVGGAVRDALLGCEVTDLDLATPLTPYELMRRCGSAGLRTVPTGIAHGTVTVLAGDEKLEVTTLRSDVSTDGRHADVNFTEDWHADAERRDFTINAIYYDFSADDLFDPCGGVDDLRDRRVRFIGNPLERIAEDHLRILRFFRFTARFAAVPDEVGVQACAARANDLMALSRERIAGEWLKLLALPDPCPTVELMLRNRILKAVLPELDDAGPSRLRALVASEQSAGVAPNAVRRFAALLPMQPELAEGIANRLKFSKQMRKRLVSAAHAELEENPEVLAYRVGTVEAQDRLLLAARPDDAHSLNGWSPPTLPIGGGELIRRGLPAGPGVAAMLKRIERGWLASGFPTDAPFEALVEHELEAFKVGRG